MAELLDGKVAIVSGVGPGLGRAICAALRDHGAQLVVGDLDGAAVERAVADHGAVGQVTDITDVAACAALVDLAVQTHGRVDILVNDAYHGGDFTAFEDADLANWRATADVNVWGTLQMTRAALPVMKAQGDGRVVMVLTQGVEWVLPTFGAYTSSKSALAHLVKLLATELGQYGIRVNGICPGPIFADALQGYLGHAGPGARASTCRSCTTSGRPRLHCGIWCRPTKWPGRSCTSPRISRDRSPGRRSTPAPASGSTDPLSDVPVLDPSRYGEGVYRRRIRLVLTDPGVVRAELEDDYHHFRCTLTFADGLITGCEGEAVRHPWTTCPGAMGLLRSLAGTPLDAAQHRDPRTRALQRALHAPPRPRRARDRARARGADHPRLRAHDPRPRGDAQ